MPHMPMPEVPPAPITDELVEALISLFEQGFDGPLTDAELTLVLKATPGCLRELLTYRRHLGRQYLAAWSVRDNVIHLANLREPPEIGGAA